jgi:hypothetical protein
VDKLLEKAFDIANYAATFSSQIKILKEEFNQNLIYYHNGGVFTITKELICFVNLLKDSSTNKNVVLVDDNQTPIEILDIDKFLEEILSKYTFAVNSYYTRLSSMKSSRTVESILEK